MSFFFFILINDITTDPSKPVYFDGIKKLSVHEGKSLEYPEIFRDKQKKYYPQVKPWITLNSAEKIFSHALETAEKNSWQLIKIDEKKLRFEAVAKTRLLGFRDDIAFEIRKKGDENHVHMRSRSRIGRSDFGVNAKRIKNFMKTLKKNEKAVKALE